MGVSVFKAIHRSVFVKVSYFILVVAFFLGFGILSTISNFSPFSKIKIGDKEVLSDEFMLVLRDVSSNVRADDENLVLRTAFDLLVAKKIISMEVEKWGFYVGNEDLVRFIGNALGIRDYRDYRSLLRTLGATEKSFENYLRDSYFFTKFQDIIVRMETAGDLDDFQNFITTAEGSRHLRIAKINKSLFKVEIPEKEIEKNYIANREKYKIPEKREFFIAKFPSESTAKNFFEESLGKKFENFSEFEKYVLEKGGDAVPSIVGKSDAVRDFVYSALFGEGITEGQFLPPVNVGEKWWVIYVSKIFPERFLSLEEASPQIKTELISKFVKQKVEDIVKSVEDKIKTADDFEKFFRKYSSDIYSETVPIYMDIFPRIGNSPSLSNAVFSDRENFVFGVLESGNELYVVFVGEKFPSYEAKIAEFFSFDAERVVQGFIASAISNIKIKPPSRDEAIAKLTGRQR